VGLTSFFNKNLTQNLANPDRNFFDKNQKKRVKNFYLGDCGRGYKERKKATDRGGLES